MSGRRLAAACMLLLPEILAIPAAPAPGAVIERFEAKGRQAALTFDACPTKAPPRFDEGILAFLLAERIPFTVFVSGEFARGARDRMRELSATGLVEFENHSFSHPHLRGEGAELLRAETTRAGDLIRELTGTPPRFFRFPFGDLDAGSVGAVEGLGYRVIGWTMASGDPDPNLPPEGLVRGVVEGTKPGAIHIFHINGRGWKTAEALPAIVRALRGKGYSFVLLRDVIPPPGPPP